jgi:hypothetical protein
LEKKGGGLILGLSPLSIDIVINYLNVIVSSPNTGVNIATTSLMIDQAEKLPE